MAEEAAEHKRNSIWIGWVSRESFGLRAAVAVAQMNTDGHAKGFAFDGLHSRSRSPAGPLIPIYVVRPQTGTERSVKYNFMDDCKYRSTLDASKPMLNPHGWYRMPISNLMVNACFCPCRESYRSGSLALPTSWRWKQNHFGSTWTLRLSSTFFLNHQKVTVSNKFLVSLTASIAFVSYSRPTRPTCIFY